MQIELSKFFRDDAGAVTVDWVVLTGAIVGLGILVIIPIGFSAGNSASAVSTSIATSNVGYVSQATP